jgi:hypothetical protein
MRRSNIRPRSGGIVRLGASRQRLRPASHGYARIRDMNGKISGKVRWPGGLASDSPKGKASSGIRSIWLPMPAWLLAGISGRGSMPGDQSPFGDELAVGSI